MMEAALSALLECSAYAAVVAVMLLLMRALFRRALSARLRYLLWLVLIARLLLPVTLESGFHVDSLLPAPANPLETAVQTEIPPVGNGAPQAADRADTPAPSALGTPAPMESAVDWAAIVFGVWLGGVAACLLFAAFARVRFARALRRTAVPSHRVVRMLFAGCGEALGVRGRVRLMTTTLPISPALTVLSGKSVLLLPERLTDMSALRYAMLHELTHHKRRDEWMLALMGVLRAIHWFNPFVWLAFSVMRSDMEAACDACVLTLLTPDEKRPYLATLLKLFTANCEPAAGFAQARTKRMAKSRIRSAFMRPVTGKPARLAILLLTLLLAFGCFTTACRPARGDAAGTVHPAAEAAPATPGEPVIQADDSHTFAVIDVDGRSVAFTYHDRGVWADSTSAAPGGREQRISAREAAFAAAQRFVIAFGDGIADGDLYLYVHNPSQRGEQYLVFYGGEDNATGRYMGVVEAATGQVLQAEDIAFARRAQQTDASLGLDDPIWETGAEAALTEAKRIVAARFGRQGTILPDSHYGGVQGTYLSDDPVCVDTFIHMSAGPCYMLRIRYPSLDVVWLWSFPLGWEYCKQQVWSAEEMTPALAAGADESAPAISDREIALAEYAKLADTAASLVGENMTGKLAPADASAVNTSAFVQYVQALAGVTVAGVAPLVIQSADDPAIFAGRTLYMESEHGALEAIFIGKGGDLYVMMHPETGIVEARSLSNAFASGEYTQIEVCELYGANVTGV